MKLFCTSDTHTGHGHIRKSGWLPKSGECDVLVHAGDYSGRGSVKDTWEFLHWLNEMQKNRFSHVVFIAGNHDFICENESERFQELLDLLKNPNIHYLNNSGVEIEGVKFWGSPWTPWFHDWAFNAERGPEIQEHWDLIPNETDVLITHGPPHGILDMTSRGVPVGCEELRKEVFERVRPKVHVFGHIHEDYGELVQDGIRFVNVSLCNLSYKPVQKPIIVEI